MMTVRCYLAPSSIEGLGVFSHDDIRKGDIIWRFDRRFDQLIPLETVAQAPEHIQVFLDRYGYPHADHPGHLVLDADEGRFMNHSENANTDFSRPDVGIALRDIPAGEEITCDYREFVTGELVMQPPRHKLAPREELAVA